MQQILYFLNENELNGLKYALKTVFHGVCFSFAMMQTFSKKNYFLNQCYLLLFEIVHKWFSVGQSIVKLQLMLEILNHIATK